MIGEMPMEYDVPKLLIRLQQLQAENAYLKHLLDQAGISYSTPPQIHSTEITKQLARRFFSYFWGRTDVYSKRSIHKSTGKARVLPSMRKPVEGGPLPQEGRQKGKMQ